MRRRLRIVNTGIALLGMTVATNAPAVSLVTGAAQPVTESRPSPVSLAEDNRLGGSGSLVPLMAANMQAHQVESIDAPADSAGGAPGKPLDDVAFVRAATESGRHEVSSARDALPQLKQPELKRIAEMLVNEHGNANARLAKLAEAKRWPIPAPHAAEPPAAGTAKADFDATWTAAMIAGHERSVALYRAQAQSGDDKDLRKYARDTLPTIENHLAQLKSLQQPHPGE